MEQRLKGVPASLGIAAGQATRLVPGCAISRQVGDPAAEQALLAEALAKARIEVGALVRTLEGSDAGIMEFQAAMLEDPELSNDARVAIAAGMPADIAWSQGINSEIGRYRCAASAHFRALATDLEDIRDRVLRRILRQPEPVQAGAGHIIVADDLPPSAFLQADWSQGGAVILAAGSPGSHVASLARSRGVPMVVGLGPAIHSLTGLLLVDGKTGIVLVSPAASSLAAAAQAATSRGQAVASARRHEPAITRDGQRIGIFVNISAMSDVEDLAPEICDGIGLVRTEFLVDGMLRDEEAQYRIYARLIRWAAGRPVTLRTLDAGGDKPVPGYTVAGEANPFLGQRGIRLSLQSPEIFRIQLRAILRAAALGPVNILLPMVTTPGEVAQARDHLMAMAKALAEADIAHRIPPVGIMVEVPVTAMVPEIYGADFLSIGSNDLAQYASATARDNAQLAGNLSALHPGVMAMIANVIRYGSMRGLDVCLCGDAAGDAAVLPALVHAGLRSVSVAPGLLSLAKDTVRKMDSTALAAKIG